MFFKLLKYFQVNNLEFKHLYTDDEFMLLAEEWLKEWENSRRSSQENQVRKPNFVPQISAKQNVDTRKNVKW
jgi:hypothetical protein